MYLSCLLIEDGIRHLFYINLIVSCLFSSYSLACVSAPSSTWHLCLWNCRPHCASSLISYLSYQSVLDDTPISQPLPLLQWESYLVPGLSVHQSEGHLDHHTYLILFRNGLSGKRHQERARCSCET